MIIWFGGGLGNQMFQYALYKAAEERGFDVKADLYWYTRNPEPFELKRVFDINLKLCSSQELIKERYSLPEIMDKILLKLHVEHRAFNKRKIVEKSSNYIDNLLSFENRDKYLWGYWQSESYFKSFEDKIQRIYTFPEMDEKNKAIYNDMEKNNSVSVHVRRTSYLTPSAIKLYENLSESNYYNNAIKKIKEITNSEIKLYLFTDDIEWCRKNLDLDSSPVFIDNNRGANSYKDMQLMSCCKHNILANSSFSWWGAWLNKNSKKIVIAPEKWFLKSSGYTSSMIIPDDWLAI